MNLVYHALQESEPNMAEMKSLIKFYLAGTAFHSSQNVMNDEVTRMIPWKENVSLRAIHRLYPNIPHRYENSREVKSSIPRKRQFHFQT